MSPNQPYHKYVFDTARRLFLGQFEEMYQHEEIEGYDSWCQDDIAHLSKRLSLTILGRADPVDRVLDIGCGKGAFTHLLKTPLNHVMGIDVSATAVAKARSRFSGIEFLALPVSQISTLANPAWDLVTALELLSYIEDWRATVRVIASMTQFLYLTLYLPPRPIGFVKSFDDLTAEIARHFSIEVHVILNREQLLLLARVLPPKP